MKRPHWPGVRSGPCQCFRHRGERDRVNRGPTDAVIGVHRIRARPDAREPIENSANAIRTGIPVRSGQSPLAPFRLFNPIPPRTYHVSSPLIEIIDGAAKRGIEGTRHFTLIILQPNQATDQHSEVGSSPSSPPALLSKPKGVPPVFWALRRKEKKKETKWQGTERELLSCLV